MGTDRARRVGAAAAVVILLAMLVVLTVQAARSNSRADDLRRHGVAVTVRVTSCLGESGGMGTHIAGYSCKGRFTLDGHTYLEPISGTNTPYTTGQTVRAIVAADDPSLVTTSGSAGSDHARWTAYIGAAVCLLLLIVLLAVLAVFELRRRRRGVTPRVSRSRRR